MKYFGVTRFSVYSPGSHAWRISSPKFDFSDGYREKLFSNERLAERFRIFFDIAMPIYNEMQKNFDYIHIVQYSPSMPIEWLIKLRHESSKYDFIRLLAVSEDENVDDSRKCEILRILDFEKYTGVFTWFRVDDDDLLPNNYLDIVSEHISESLVGYIVSLGKGYTALYFKGNVYCVREVHWPLLGLGQLYVCHYDHNTKKTRQPVSGGHQFADKKSPVILDSRYPGFFWFRHAEQDTSSGRGLIESTKKLIKQLSAMDAADYTEIAKIFGDVVSNIVDIKIEENCLFDNRIVGKNIYKVNLDLGPGVYLLPYTFRTLDEKKEIKAGIASFGLVGESLSSDNTHLFKSSRDNIGWFDYLSASSKIEYLVFSVPDRACCHYIHFSLWESKSDAEVKMYFPILVSP